MMTSFKIDKTRTETRGRVNCCSTNNSDCPTNNSGRELWIAILFSAVITTINRSPNDALHR
jgi:hypothetical protein